MAKTRFVKPNGTRIKNRIFTPIAKAKLKRIVLMVALANRIECGIAVRSPDKRVMSEDSYLLSVFSNIALVPDGGLSWFLPKFMGYAKAYEHAIEAKKILASDCLKYGIANKVVPSDQLEQITLDWANQLAKRSSQSLNHTKRLMRESLAMSYWDTFSNEAEIQNELTVSDQNREAVKAFLEKREPNFD